jgi:hypothetical protein
MEQVREKKDRGGDDGVAEKVVVAAPPSRCPWCHDECAPEGSVVCQACLSRHHAPCWREGGKCASCGQARAMQGAPPTLVIAPAELELVRRGAVREAVERLAARTKASEGDAARALLEAVARELADRKSPLVTLAITVVFFGAVIAALAIVATEIIPPFNLLAVAIVCGLAWGVFGKLWRS